MTPRALLLAAPLAWAGCTTVSHHEAFAPAAKIVHDRTGVSPVWSDAGSEDPERAKQVAALLEGELTLTAAVQVAVLNNPSLRATFEDLRISRADLLQASRLANPTFSASVRWPNERPRKPNTEFGFAFELLEGLLIPLKRTYAQTELQQAQRRVADAVFHLITEVKSAVYTVQAHQLLRDRLAAIVEVNAIAADLAQRQYDAGNINKLALLNQQNSLHEAQLALHRADAEIRSDRETLNRLLGLTSTQANWKLTEALPTDARGLSTAIDFEELAVKQRLDLQIARSSVELAQSSLKLKRTTRWFPAGVTVGVDTEREPSGERLTGPNLEIGLPIFDGGQVELEMLTAALRKAEAEYDAALINLRSEVREKRDHLNAAATTVRYFQTTLLPHRKELLREMLLQYNAMQESGYELLSARHEQLAAERESIEALRDYWIARAEFEQAIGGTLPEGAETTATELKAD